MAVQRVPSSKKDLSETKSGRELRDQALSAGRYTCCACGASKAGGASVEVDHKRPRKRGGTHDPANLHVLCQHCNSVKGGWLDWRYDKIAEALQDRELRRNKEIIRSILKSLAAASIVPQTAIERWDIAVACNLVEQAHD